MGEELKAKHGEKLVIIDFTHPTAARCLNAGGRAPEPHPPPHSQHVYFCFFGMGGGAALMGMAHLGSPLPPKASSLKTLGQAWIHPDA